jgi:hypothetical protein
MRVANDGGRALGVSSTRGSAAAMISVGTFTDDRDPSAADGAPRFEG